MSDRNNRGSNAEPDDCHPAISVIVPAYNKPQFLSECLRSIQAQTFTDWECIVVDDGSPRGAEIRAAVEAMQDSRFRLVRHDRNRGPGAARNTGARESRGSLLLFADEDDFVSEEWIEALRSRLLQANSEVAVCGFAYNHPQGPQKAPALPRGAEFLSGTCPLGVGFLIRKEVWQRLGGYDETSVDINREDFEFWVRVFAAKCRVSSLDSALYYYRREALERSREIVQRLREVETRGLIYHKHKNLYDSHPVERRKFLAKGYDIEGLAHWTGGNRRRGLLRTWQALFMMPNKKRLQNAVKRSGVMLRDLLRDSMKAIYLANRSGQDWNS